MSRHGSYGIWHAGIQGVEYRSARRADIRRREDVESLAGRRRPRLKPRPPVWTGQDVAGATPSTLDTTSAGAAGLENV